MKLIAGEQKIMQAGLAFLGKMSHHHMIFYWPYSPETKAGHGDTLALFLDDDVHRPLGLARP